MSDHVDDLQGELDSIKVKIPITSVLSTSSGEARIINWRHPLVVLIAGCLFVMAAACTGLGLALWSATTDRNELSSQLNCNRAFAASVDIALAKAVSAQAQSASTTLQGLDAIAPGGNGDLQAILKDVPAIVSALSTSAQALSDTTAARQTAVESCK